MTTTVHHDENAPRSQRWRVLRGEDDQGRWITVESFPSEREAHAFARGFTLGSQYGDRYKLHSTAGLST